MASSFMFHGTSENSQSSTPDATSSRVSRATSDLHSAPVVVDVENEYGTYHDPSEDQGSIVDSEASPLWGSIRNQSFDFVREVAVGNSGLSSRALSRLLLVERSALETRDGRFSVDLQRGQKLDKVVLPRTPDAPLNLSAYEKPPKRSILSPCLPFLQRTMHHNSKPGSNQQAAAAAPTSRLQSMNSFTARLGPITETPSTAGPIHVQ